MAAWGQWYFKVPYASDSDVVEFYKRTSGPKVTVPDYITDLAATPAPRTAFAAAVWKEKRKWFWQKSTDDPLVKKMAAGLDATLFLMDWYTKYSRTKMPYMYSPTWNLQTKTAIDTIQDLQKGLKLHNAFIHWRFGGNEVWCGVLYFAIALMDKWPALLTGGNIIGFLNFPPGTPDPTGELSKQLAESDSSYRLAVGFGLAYYLAAAICLDVVALPLWATANDGTDQPLKSLNNLKQATAHAAAARRRLYWHNFAKFFFLHAWGLSAASTMMWVFAGGRDATILFLAYVGAYTGLLWYQYNRIYAGSAVLGDLIVTAFVGLFVGLLLQELADNFTFGAVIALATSSWMANILSFRTAKIGWPKRKEMFTAARQGPKVLVHNLGPSVAGQGVDAASNLLNIYSEVPVDKRVRLLPSTLPGSDVARLITPPASTEEPRLLDHAFPECEELFEQVVAEWQQGNIIVEAMFNEGYSEVPPQTRSMTIFRGNRLHIIVLLGAERIGETWYENNDQLCQTAAEAIVHASAEAMFGMSHHDSMLIELLLAANGRRDDIPIAEGVKRVLESSAAVREEAIAQCEQNLFSDLFFGMDCDREWQDLPLHVRTWLLDRCCGRTDRLTKPQNAWVRSHFGLSSADEAAQCVVRWSLSIALQAIVADYARALQQNHVPAINKESRTLRSIEFGSDVELAPSPTVARPSATAAWHVSRFIRSVRMAIKLSVVALVADPELQRELDYVTAGQSVLIRWPARILYNGIWMYCNMVQQVIVPWFAFYNRPNVIRLQNDMRGIKTVIGKSRILIESLDGVTSCFMTAEHAGSWKLYQYAGRHETQPDNQQNLVAVNTYGAHLVLKSREEYAASVRKRTFTYEYDTQNALRQKRLPLSRHCVEGDLHQQLVLYDQKGYTKSGSYYKDNNLVKFKYWYRKNARYDDELLRAEFILDHIRMRVSWCYPPPEHAEKLDRWIPHTKVTEASFVDESGVYHSTWDYQHKWHPIITTTYNGTGVETPDMIKYDWFDILKKPRKCTFAADDPLLPFASVKTNWISRLLRFNTVRYPVSTSLARSHLWKTWGKSREHDAVTIRWLDYVAMRRDRVLAPYWRYRDSGRLKAAKQYLEQHADAILAQTDMDPDVSAKSAIAYKFGDLSSFGQGGDSRLTSRTPLSQLRDTHDTLHVMAMDTGTWPIEGGGVSACRRDLVNGLDSIRWHVIAEAANDFGTPKFQIERNVESLSILPLWGLDFLTPSHGVFEDTLDSAVQERWNSTSTKDIEKNFLPILESLVRCARAVKFEQRHVAEATDALVRLNAYFEHSRHWGQVWMSRVVKERWRELWLAEDMENTLPVSQWLDAELPTLQHLDWALDRWHRYLFIFSLPVPEKVPDVFQASHHFAGASYGILWKVLRGSSLHIWDHGISWREVTVTLSAAMSWDTPFVCNSLLSLSRMTSVLTLYHADILLPCADFFNPDWETEHATQAGQLQHRRLFGRKIDPIVNGITGMEAFEPIKEIKTKKPTVVMLSHVRFIKDIKNAILAADVIVNSWGIKDYQLDIYGDMEKSPSYSVECKEIIASKSLRDNVALKGLGKPAKVLENAWLFLNSSVSEGLPLAMGEAALTGVPIVCTDVGASFRVVTDPVTWKKFSAVVAPNDPHALAIAQIEVLGLLGEWAEYAGDKPEDLTEPLPKLTMQRPSDHDIDRITKRMYAKTEQRRALGMIGRQNVLNSFSEDRYLREHEQMLWIGKLRNPKNAPSMSMPVSRSSFAEDEKGFGYSNLFQGQFNDSTHSLSSHLMRQ